jgi:flagellar biosynthesis/type III secretory pathway chaperone
MVAWEQQLSEILEREDSILSRISNEARLKTDALKNGDIVRLDSIVNREQPLALQLQAAEQKRRSLLEDNGLSSQTLSELSERAVPGYKDKLKNQLKSMLQASLRLKRINDLNAELTRTRLEFYNYLRGPGEAEYENNGKVKEVTAANALIDRKA